MAAPQPFHLRLPRNPVIFCHGFVGSGALNFGPLKSWVGIQEVLEAFKIEVFFPAVSTVNGPFQRAETLAQQITERYSGRWVHLIGHGTGGVDARCVASYFQNNFGVLSVTTISTPHRGSWLADEIIGIVGNDFVQGIAALVNKLRIVGDPDGDGNGPVSLTSQFMEAFNRNVPNLPSVYYFSWGAELEPGSGHDGVVEVQSARWGYYLGTLGGVGHNESLGSRNSRNFNPGIFYLQMMDHLAQVVEGCQ